jgi:hypothetical protein
MQIKHKYAKVLSEQLNNYFDHTPFEQKKKILCLHRHLIKVVNFVFDFDTTYKSKSLKFVTKK